MPPIILRNKERTAGISYQPGTVGGVWRVRVAGNTRLFERYRDAEQYAQRMIRQPVR